MQGPGFFNRGLATAKQATVMWQTNDSGMPLMIPWGQRGDICIKAAAESPAAMTTVFLI